MPSKHCPRTDRPFLFQHGWGFSGQCWKGWQKLLASPCLLGDRGYWGAPRAVESAAQPSGFVLVCHSLGLHFLPRDLVVKAGILVVISGFAHFHGQHAADGRFTRKHIKKMLSRLETDPVGLLADFYHDCECPDGPVRHQAMDTFRLAEDLSRLDQSRLDEKCCRQFPATLLLHGREDRIVRPERSQELASLIERSQLTIVDGAGHGLPFTHPSLCLDLIAAFATEAGVLA